MVIQERGVNTKRHTVAYKIGGKWRSRREAVRLAKSGKVDGVTVRYGSNDEQFIAAMPNSGLNLYELPTRVNPKQSLVGVRSKLRPSAACIYPNFICF